MREFSRGHLFYILLLASAGHLGTILQSSEYAGCYALQGRELHNQSQSHLNPAIKALSLLSSKSPPQWQFKYIFCYSLFRANGDQLLAYHSTQNRELGSCTNKFKGTRANYVSSSPTNILKNGWNAGGPWWTCLILQKEAIPREIFPNRWPWKTNCEPWVVQLHITQHHISI